MIELGEILRTFFGLFRRKKIPDGLAVDLPIKNGDGAEVGRILIGSNGLFAGHIDIEQFYSEFSEPAVFGRLIGASISPIVEESDEDPNDMDENPHA